MASTNFKVAKQKPYAFFMLIAGIIGLFASSVLVLERLALYKDPDHVASCDFGGFVSCTSVMQSWQASLLGFPNPFIGLVAFTITITLAVVLLSGAKLPAWIMWGYQAGVTVGFGLVCFFFYSSVYEIHALCPYCMIAWLATTPLFFTTLAYNVCNARGGSTTVKRFLADWHIILTVMVVIGFGGAIFLKFILPALLV